MTVTRSRLFVAENHGNMNIFVQQMTYVCSTQVYRSTGVASFVMILSKNSLEATTIDIPSAIPSDIRQRISTHNAWAPLGESGPYERKR